MTAYLTTDNLRYLAAMLEQPFVRDMGLLDSAAHRPQATFEGEDVYPTLHDKAAALLESIVRNHPLVDGNKRLGWVAVRVLYALNGEELTAPEDDAFDLVVGVACGRLDLDNVAARLSEFTARAGE